MICGEKRGTYAGLNQHKKAGEQSCPECREAGRIYMADYRRRPENRQRDRVRSYAYGAALQSLRHAHQVEFDRLLEAEYRRLGWRP